MSVGRLSRALYLQFFLADLQEFSMAPTQTVQGVSYNAQHEELFSHPPLNLRARLPKPSLEAQRSEPDAKLIPGSDVYATKQLNNWISREPWTYLDALIGFFFVAIHLLCLAAPFTLDWYNFFLCLITYCVIGCLGIDVSFHRQLTHRSFASPKWVEYGLACLGCLGLQRDPIHWVKHHRYHHQNTDTALDPHSTYEGFWWAHYGWLMHSKVLGARAGDNWIVKDLVADPFYRFLRRTHHWHAIGQYMFLYWLGGWPTVVWAGAVRQVMMWHVTWLVNSACHIWGARPYATGDLSTNNSWLALLTFGESWHNNHHAFPYSARHGLEWWQVDISWGAIRVLELLGLAWDIRIPSEATKAKMAAKVGPNGDAGAAACAASGQAGDSVTKVE